ncbi:MAG: acylphosphatase [Prochloraceae cyanobacterium]
MENELRSSNKKCVRVLISGKVQGVGYRFSTFQEAKKLGVTGWVKNLIDARVEAVFCGEENAVKTIIKWCADGPPAAVVKSVEVEEIEPRAIDNFEIRY